MLEFSSGTWRLGRCFKESGQDRVAICLVRAYASATTMCAKVFITDITVTLPAPNVIAADIFGTGIFH